MDTTTRQHSKAAGSEMAAEPAGSDTGLQVPLHRLGGDRDQFEVPTLSDAKAISLSIVIFGASGDLAKKYTYPQLFNLHSKG